MKITDFELGKKYKRDDLISAFGGSFMRGINICKKTNTIVITSIHTGNRIYDDKLFDGDVMLYTGEGRKGDQKKTYGNNTDSHVDSIDGNAGERRRYRLHTGARIRKYCKLLQVPGNG